MAQNICPTKYFSNFQNLQEKNINSRHTFFISPKSLSSGAFKDIKTKKGCTKSQGSVHHLPIKAWPKKYTPYLV